MCWDTAAVVIVPERNEKQKWNTFARGEGAQFVPNLGHCSCEWRHRPPIMNEPLTSGEMWQKPLSHQVSPESANVVRATEKLSLVSRTRSMKVIRLLQRKSPAKIERVRT